MARSIRSLFLVTLLLVPGGSAHAHGNGLPWIWLEYEQVMPGDRFEVLVIDFEPYGQVEVQLSADEAVRRLGSITCEGDGHGEAEMVVPDDFPIGYAEVTATDSAGNEAATLLYVGEMPDGIGPPAPAERPTVPGAPASTPGQWWADPSVIVLALLLLGTAAALVLMVLRRLRAPTGPGGGPRPR
ncbi:MAG TPA: hypothetical protein VM305_03555 [Candidatus Limnocylindrales bacterium]|nr:hypothetical protein [Candidatus Limnocylindrales bacterium]